MGDKICRRNVVGGYRLNFRCPGCDDLHAVSADWWWNGSTTAPTFHPSVLVRYGDDRDEDVCHSFVSDGKIQFLDDCTHKLAGKTVDVPDWDNYLGLTAHPAPEKA
jgi:hypothetical protein